MSDTSSVTPLKTTEHAPSAGQKPLQPAVALSALSKVEATLSVHAGEVTTTVGEVLGLKEGTVLALDRALNAPFDLMLHGTVIARGELVAVGDQWGLRLTQVQAQST